MRRGLRDIKGLLKEIEALRESEASYRNILALAPDSITISRLKDGCYLQVNDAFCQRTGYSREETIGKTSLELSLFVDPNDRIKLLEAVQQLGRVEGREIRFRAKDGSILYDLVSATRIRFQAQDCLLSVAKNINPLKEAQRALAESERKYRTILETMEEGYGEVDLKGNFTFCNDALCRIHGRSREEMIGMNNREYTTPETAKRIFKIYNGIYKTGIPAKIVNYEIIRKDGSIAMVEDSAALLRDENGDPIGFFVLTRDRTEQRKAEEELRRSEERYRTILEDIEEGYYEVDIAGNFTFFNEALCRIQGYSRDELMGMNNRAYMDPETAKKVYEIFNGVYRTGKTARIRDWQIIRKDGTRRIVEGSISLMRDAAGRKIGFRGIVRDVTERKRSEEKLHYMATHDHLTGLPNRSLFNDRLMLAVTQAERSQRSVAVMMLDLDRFKDVNDSMGHDMGDKLLQLVGKRLIELLRKGDTVARVGGDEFLVLISDITGVADARIIAQKIINAFHSAFLLEGREVRITTSVGIAIYPEDGGDADTLLKHADIAMYRAKDKGRDNFHFFTQP